MAVPEGVITTTDILQAEVVPEVVPVEVELAEELLAVEDEVLVEVIEEDDLPELPE